MKIAYVVGMALGELAQAKAVAFYARNSGDQNIFIAKEPRLISSIEGDGFEVIPTRDTSTTRKIVKQIGPDVLFLCNSKSVSISDDPILDEPPLPPEPLICSLDSNWLFSQDRRAFSITPTWIDRIYVVMPSEVYQMGLIENGGHYKIPKIFREKIHCPGFVPSGKRITTAARGRTRNNLKIKENEKLIFVYFGFLEEVLAPVFFPVLREVVYQFRQNNKNIRVLFKGKYSFQEKWVIQRDWFKTENEFNTHMASADLIIQHHGLGTLPKAIHNQVPAICLVPEIEKDIPYYKHSEFYEVEPFRRLNLCETLPCNISSKSSNKCMHFFLSEPERCPISDISISAKKLKELLTNLLYDKGKIESIQDAQGRHFENGEKNIYKDLIDSLKGMGKS